MRVLAVLGIVLWGLAGTAVASTEPLLRPADGEAFFGDVVAAAPRDATRATVSSRGVVRQVRIFGGFLRTTVSGAPGPRGVTVVFRGPDGYPIVTRRTSGAYLLPASGAVAVPGSRRSVALERSLARIASRHTGVTGIWVQRLWDGRTAGVNADAEFPAGSLVKLPLVVGSVMRMGRHPWRHPAWRDVVAVLTRSDNSAANNLMKRFGSGCGTAADATAADGLRRLGARQSTFTDCYLTEDELQPRLPDGGRTSTPAWSNRHTTARDMGRMLFALHAAAVPTRAGTRQTGIDSLRARLIIDQLLQAVQVGQNANLFVDGLPAETPLAGKNGWRKNEQHSATLAYVRRGPLILVVLTQHTTGANVADARAIGREVAQAANGA
ncbi:MAG: hypothetical protein EXQ74_06025 [Thermoleophilia bacterium]|nr:hypothetical protein [Thermoleophilia bacterium]